MRWYSAAQRLEGAALLEELLNSSWPRVHRGILLARLGRAIPWLAPRLWRLREDPDGDGCAPTVLYAGSSGELVWSWSEESELEAWWIERSGRRRLLRYGLQVVELIEELHLEAMKKHDRPSAALISSPSTQA